MLKSKTKWQIKASDSAVATAIATELGVPQMVARLLVNRGFDHVDKAKQFLSAGTMPFHDPFLFQDMEKSVERIEEAIATGEKIVIFGDYDADGVTATTILMRALTEIGAEDVSYYIPNRFTEGYGPNNAAVDKLHKEGATLIITVDTGIAAIEQVAHGNELGIDWIITDHHQIGEQLPAAYAIIHPKKAGDHYPYPELAGAGVALKLAHGLLGGVTEELVSIAAIGTVADLVELHDENRLIVTQGIKALKTSKLPGVRALAQVAGIAPETMNEETIGFTLAPRINAAGRLASADVAVELLLASSVEQALPIATKLDQYNSDRQKLVKQMTEEAIELVEHQVLLKQFPIIVVARVGWNPGVVGIVASRLVDLYGHPALVLGIDEATGEAKGSGRSIEGYHLYERLTEQAALLSRFGGHPMAAGLTMPASHVDEFRVQLNEAIASELSSLVFAKRTTVDAVIKVEEATVDALRQLEQMAPFGSGNPKPILMIEQAAIASARRIGSDANHFKGQVTDATGSLDVIGFGQGHVAEQIAANDTIALLGTLSLNTWNNITKPQMMLHDIACDDVQVFDLRSSPLTAANFAMIPAPRKLVYFQQETLKLLPEVIATEAIHATSVDDAESTMPASGNLCLIDFPQDITVLEAFIRKPIYSRLYLFMKQSDPAYFANVPTREQFKSVYGFLVQNGPFNLKYADQLCQRNKWVKGTVNFILEVFFELSFVTIDSGTVIVNQTSVKKDLTESALYNQKTAQVALESKLLFASKRDFLHYFKASL